MLYEYAVEPTCLNNWHTFRYLIENFGVPQGRLIAEYPGHWLRLVYDSCGKVTFLQKQKMTVELERLKRHGLCRSPREYDGKVKWLQNAISQQSVKPFHAIIALESNPELKVLNSDDLDKSNPLWAVQREAKVARTKEELSAKAAKLLQISERVLFVDKHFDPAIDRWRDLLLHLCHVAAEGRRDMPSFEYHTKIDDDEFGNPPEKRKEDFKALCERELSRGLPPGSLLKVFRWDKKHQGDFFHARYILTEKGGLRFDWGLDIGKKIGETTDVSLLDGGVWEEYWSWFQEESQVMELVDCVVVNAAT